MFKIFNIIILIAVTAMFIGCGNEEETETLIHRDVEEVMWVPLGDLISDPSKYLDKTIKTSGWINISPEFSDKTVKIRISPIFSQVSDYFKATVSGEGIIDWILKYGNHIYIEGVVRKDNNRIFFIETDPENSKSIEFIESYSF